MKVHFHSNFYRHRFSVFSSRFESPLAHGLNRLLVQSMPGAPQHLNVVRESVRTNHHGQNYQSIYFVFPRLRREFGFDMFQEFRRRHASAHPVNLLRTRRLRSRRRGIRLPTRSRILRKAGHVQYRAQDSSRRNSAKKLFASHARQCTRTHGFGRGFFAARHTRGPSPPKSKSHPGTRFRSRATRSFACCAAKRISS